MLLADEAAGAVVVGGRHAQAVGLERGGPAAHPGLGHEDVVEGATPPADERRAPSWSSDHTLKLWTWSAADFCTHWAGHRYAVMGARSRRADGRRLLSWSEDRTLKLWDLERGKLLHTLAGHKDVVEAQCFWP